MPTLADIRAKYPQYEDMSDEQIAQGMHRKFYADMPFDDFAKRINYAPVNAPGAQESNGVSKFDIASAFSPVTLPLAISKAFVDNPTVRRTAGDIGQRVRGSLIEGLGGTMEGVERMLDPVTRPLEAISNATNTPNLSGKHAELAAIYGVAPDAFAKMDEPAKGRLFDSLPEDKQQAISDIVSGGIGAAFANELTADFDPSDVSTNLRGAGEYVKNDISPEGALAVKNSQVSGSLLDPENISFGKDPSVMGFALQGSDVMGQMAPAAMAAYLTRGRSLAAQTGTAGTITAAQTGGFAAGEEHRRIMEMPIDELLEVPEFAKMIDDGAEAGKARAHLAEMAASGAFKYAAPVGALSGVLLGGIANKTGQSIISRVFGGSKPARFLGGTFVEGGGEGVEEVFEGVAQRGGAAQATGETRDLMEGSAAEFTLGTLAGPMGGGGAMIGPDPNASPTNPATSVGRAGAGVNAGDVLGDVGEDTGPIKTEGVPMTAGAGVTIDEDGNVLEERSGLALPPPGPPPPGTDIGPAGPLQAETPPDWMVDSEETASAPGDWQAREQAKRQRAGGPGMGPVVDGVPTMAPDEMAQAAFDTAMETATSAMGRAPSKSSVNALAAKVAERFGVDPAALVKRSRNLVRVPAPIASVAPAPVAVTQPAAAQPVVAPELPRGRMFRRGRDAEAVELPGGAWLTRRRVAGHWQPWQRRRSFDPSGAHGYVPYQPQSGSVRTPVGTIRVGEDRREAAQTGPKAPNDIIDTIIAAGGISREAARMAGIDPSMLTTRRGATRWLFPRNNGMSLSGLRELLTTEGFFHQDDPDAPPTVSDDDAFEVFNRALQGERIVSPNRAAEEAAYQASLRESNEEAAPPVVEPVVDDPRTDEDEQIAAEFLSRIEADPIARRVFDDFDADEDMDALGIVELTEVAERLGATPSEIRQAYNAQGDADLARNLWELIHNKEIANGPVARERQARDRDGAPTQPGGVEAAWDAARRTRPAGDEGAGAARSGEPVGQAALEQAAELERLRARVAELESVRGANEVTGLPGKAAFEADESLGWSTVAAIDMDGLGRLNDATSHQSANEVMAAMADAMRAAQVDGVRFYHLHGDELAARFQSPDDAASIMPKLQEDLAAMSVHLNLTLENGTLRAYSYDGIGITFGLGANYATADAKAIQSKRDREAAGIRQNKNQPGPPRQLRDLSGNTERRNNHNSGGRPTASHVDQEVSPPLDLTDNTVVTPPPAERPASQGALFGVPTAMDRERLRFERDRPRPPATDTVDIEEAINQTPPSGGVSVSGGDTSPAASAATTEEYRNGTVEEAVEPEDVSGEEGTQSAENVAQEAKEAAGGREAAAEPGEAAAADGEAGILAAGRHRQAADDGEADPSAAGDAGVGLRGQAGASRSASGRPRTPAGSVTANTIFTEDAAERARALLRARLGSTNSGLDPELVQAGITLAGYHIEKGARRFADFARAMLDDLGEIVQPYLKSWYMAAKYDPRLSQFSAELSGATEVESANVDTIGGGDVPGTNVDLERDREDAEDSASAVGATVPASERQAAAGTGEDRAEARPGRGGRSRRSRVPADGATADRNSRDLALRGGEFVEQPSLLPAGADGDQRGGGLGDGGVPVEPEAASATAAAADQGTPEFRKRAEQRAAYRVAVKVGDLANIRETLPYLLPGQQEDVHKAEQRFAKPDGYGMLFTNGTGTGKTFTGLGIVKRFARLGKTNTIIIAPSDKIIEDWIESGKALGLNITRLDGTNDAGSGIVITTYAAFGQNRTLADRQWDLVVPDEAHYLAQAADGTPTSFLQNLRAITKHPDGYFTRTNMIHRDLADRIAALSGNLKGEASPALKALYREIEAKRDAVKADVMASQGAARTRAAFLSATPFAYEKAIDWANGYLFDYNEGQESDAGRMGYNSGDNRERFFMLNFGYRMRYNKLTQPDANVDTGVMQRQFNAKLKRDGSLSSRILNVDADYDRKFILTESAIGTRIDAALQWIRDHDSDSSYDLQKLISDSFDHLSRRFLLEAIKAEEVIPHIREHMAKGRKVVVFHDYKKGGGFNPFNLQHQGDNSELNSLIDEFRAEFRDLVNYPFQSMPSPILAFQREFPGVLLFNGDVSPKDRRANVAKFNDDASGPQVILVQSAAGKEGISLHDTTGKHQRVLFNLGLPTQPTTAIQQEGRIYRTGQVTNALFRYLNTGTNWERWAFATTIATRSSTAENLALGEQARALRDAFIAGFEESDNYRAGDEGEGTGGKERDRAANEALTEFDRARSFYFGTQKKNSRTKSQEGTDYFATPEPLGLKMVEWADIRPGETALEPSAGHGAIARWFPETNQVTVIEPSNELSARLAMVRSGQNTRMENGRFEDHNIVNKYDVIVMNPPFGSGGRTAIDHLDKAARHLRDGGRIVALIPTGPAADAKFQKWFFESSERAAKPLAKHPTLGPIFRGDTVAGRDDRGSYEFVVESQSSASGAAILRAAGSPFAVVITTVTGISPGQRTERYNAAAGLHLTADIELPAVTFERAGTQVRTRILVIDKIGDDARNPGQSSRDYTDAETIKDFFDRIEHASIPERMKPRTAAEEAAPEGKAGTRESAKTAEKAAKASAAEAGTKIAQDAGEPIVEHVTQKGKTLRGVVRSISMDEAKALDAYTFRKNGGFFIRLENLAPKADMPSNPAPQGWAQTEPAGDALSTATIDAEVAKARAEFGDTATIEVLDSIQDAPASNETKRLYPGASGLTDGASRVWIFRRGLQSLQALRTTLAHEIIGHIGVERVIGADWPAVMDAIKRIREGKLFASPAVVNAIRSAESRYPGADDLTFAREAVAIMAETGVTGSLWDRIVAAVRKFLRRVFKSLQWSDAEIRDLLRRAGEAARKPAVIKGSAFEAAQVVFHGTPHKVDRFRMDKIGTGEGAQAYGYGLYFASLREVADGYRVALTADQNRRQFAVAAAIASSKWFKPGLVVNGKKYYDRMELQGDIDRRDLTSFDMPADVAKVFTEKLAEPSGNLYRVDVPEDSDLLDWDKPLSEQPEKVRAAILDAMQVNGVRRGEKVPLRAVIDLWGGIEASERMPEMKMSGQGIYHHLIEQSGSAKAASELLNDAGIPGLRYLDGNSRGNGEGSHNYVIWDESVISEPTMASNPAQGPIERQMADDARAGQPIDKLFRLPFQLLGGLDSHGRLKIGSKLHDWLSRVLTEKTPTEDGPFGWMAPILKTVRSGLIDRYGVPQDFVQRDERRESEVRSVLMHAARVATDLEGLTTAEAKVLQAMLTGQEMPAGELGKLSQPIKEAIDQMGREAVEMGLISPEAYERNRGAYLHRSYLKYEADRTPLGKAIGRFLDKRRKKLLGDTLRRRGMTMERDTGALAAALGGSVRDGDTVTVLRQKTEAGGVRTKYQRGPLNGPAPVGWENLGDWRVMGFDGKKAKLWRDFTPAEREKMGEILDARYNITKTFALMAHDLATGRFLRDIAANPDWARADLPEGATAAEARGRYDTYADSDWVRVPDAAIPGTNDGKEYETVNKFGKIEKGVGRPVKRWGELAGMYVRAPIWRDLNQLREMQNPQLWGSAWQKVLTFWKTNKTARNPVVHVNNVMSNMMFMDLADIRLRDLYRGIGAWKRGEADEDYRNAMAHGAFAGGFADQELKRKVLQPILDDILAKQKVDGQDTAESRLGVLHLLSTIWDGIKKVDGKMLDAYNAEDEIFRLAFYLRRQSLGDTPEEAARAARRQFIDYDIRAPWVNMARNTVLPFIGYTYRAIPILAQAIAERPWKLAKYATMAAAANWLGYLFAPGDEDDERKVMAPAVQGNTWTGTPRMIRMPWYDADGNPVFLDVRRWIPAGDVFDMNQSEIGLPAWMQFGGPLQLAGELMLNKQAFTKQPIVDPLTDTTGEKAGKVASWAWKAMAPNAPWIPESYSWDKIGQAITGETDELGRDYSVVEATASVLGVKAAGMDVALQRRYRDREFDRVDRELDFDLSSLKRERGRNKISDERFKAAVAKIVEKKRRLAVERRRVLSRSASKPNG